VEAEDKAMSKNYFKNKTLKEETDLNAGCVNNMKPSKT
jgi:hypothetical protein